MRKVGIKLLSKCDHKLAFCKLVKECSGCGLKDAKDFVDSVCNDIGIFKELEIRAPYQVDDSTFDPLTSLKKDLNNIGNFEVIGGLSWERDLKMLKLGIGDVDDYSRFIIEYIDYVRNTDILNDILSKLDKKDLVSIISKINFE